MSSDRRGSVGAAPSAPRISVVIVTWNGAPLLMRCLASLQVQSRPAYEVVVVDNASSDDSVDLVRERHPDIRLCLLPVNRGFAGGANAGIAVATGDWIALVNNDVVLHPEWLDRMATAALDADSATGFITSKLMDLDGSRIDSAGDFVDWAFTAHQRGHLAATSDSRWTTPARLLSACAAATIYRRSFFEDVGLFDDRFFAYFEDADLCLRGARRGWVGAYHPSAEANHSTSATSGRIPGFKRYQGTRNAWWLLYKNLPAGLATRVLPRFLVTQLIWLWGAWRERELRYALRGHLHGMRGLSQFRGDRIEISASATVGPRIFSSFLMPPEAIARVQSRLHMTGRRSEEPSVGK